VKFIIISINKWFKNWYYAGCHLLYIVKLNVVMLSVVKLSVVMLLVFAPLLLSKKFNRIDTWLGFRLSGSSMFVSWMTW
jgi:hypothetical protein